MDQLKTDTSKWHSFIYSIPTPKDDIDRAYCRFLCRKYYFSTFYIFISEIVSFFALIFAIPSIIRKDSTKNNLQVNPQKTLVLVKATHLKEFQVDYKDITPDDFETDFEKITVIEKPEAIKRFLSKDAKALLFESIRRRPFQFHLNYWIYRELCFYSYIIDAYNPKAISVYVNERNVAAPIISYMCEQKGIEFISFMHGDYILQLIQGFMRFTKFYVWDEHYIKMFTKDLRCEPTQFRLYKPKKYQGICQPRESEDLYDYFATYYFGDESLQIIEKIADAFKKLKSKGKSCKVRPHPREFNHAMIKKAFKDFYVEDPMQVSLADSIENSRYIISLNSTVLSEAYFSGKEIVIDNISDIERYSNLKHRKYIMMNRPHCLLSDLIS